MVDSYKELRYMPTTFLFIFSFNPHHRRGVYCSSHLTDEEWTHSGQAIAQGYAAGKQKAGLDPRQLVVKEGQERMASPQWQKQLVMTPGRGRASAALPTVQCHGQPLLSVWNWLQIKLQVSGSFGLSQLSGAQEVK